VTRDDTDIVSALREAVADKVGRERFALWFGAGTRLALEDGRLIVAVPSPFLHEWMRSSFRSPIESACREILGEGPAVEFRVDAGLAQAPASPDISTAGAAPEVAAPALPRGPASVEPPDTPPREPRRAFADLDTFVVGPCNRLAFASAETAARRPGEMTPLVIHGPTGVGKTHLLQGIWCAVRRTRRSLRAVYLSAEQFTSGFVEALRGSGMPSFRRKYRGLDLLLLDDLQFLAGKRSTQIELLHTIDALLREGRQLVFAADRPPERLSDFGPELITRLEGGMVSRVEPPDYATRLGIVALMGRRSALAVPEDVQQFVAASFSNHARELSGALCRLQATSQALGRPGSLELARQCLDELIHTSSRVVRLPDIERAVREVFGVGTGELQSDCKAKSVSHPRMLAMWLARKYTRAALSEIGDYFGRRSHSTVISAQKRIEDWKTAGKPIETDGRRWPLEEAIRQVELRLLAG